MLFVRVVAALGVAPWLLAACTGDPPPPTAEVTTPAGILEDIRATAAAPTPTQIRTATATLAPTYSSTAAIAAVKRYVMDQRDPSLPSSVTRLQLSLLSGREFTSLARWDATTGRWRITVDREPFWFYEASEVVEYIVPTPTPRSSP